MKKILQFSYLIRYLTAFVENEGFCAERLLRNAGIDPDLIKKEPTLLTETQFLQFFRQISTAINRPTLGLELGQSFSMLDIGAIGYLGLTSPTLRHSAVVNKKYREIYNSFIRVDTEINGKYFSWKILSTSMQGDMERIAIDWEFMAVQNSVVQLLGESVYPVEVHLNFPNPGYKERYTELFNCPVYFDKPLAKLCYPVEYIDTPLPNFDPSTKNALEGLCQRLSAKLVSEYDIVNEVKMLIKERPGVFPGIEQIASHLGVSSRTLRRKLLDKKTTFQAAIDETRFEVAKEYLKESELKVNVISDLCGFSDANSFAQAFKRWSGTTPTQYRQASKSRSEASA
ncbi:MAG: AraC family transcriptional regulator ligand-binding domain-containing protein [Porticoccaceae bacterium]|nr:AraC family transcriptional regulator ligand-binding domain-containing protein [Porticoccaceae bacterium]